MQDGDGLHVKGVGEHVDEVKRRQFVTVMILVMAILDQLLQIAGEGDGVAGDVDDLRRADAGKQGADLQTDAGARGVHDDEVGALALNDGVSQEIDGR